jgi:hypothetical protein
MTEPVTWAAVGMAAVSNMATWLMILKGKNEAKRNAENNGSKPGSAKICQQRGEKIAILETRQIRFEQDIKEIKEDIKEIKGAVVK